MNNLPKVVTQQRRGRASNPRLLDRKSDALPLSHRATKLLARLHSYGIRGDVLKWLLNFLKDRTHQTRVVTADLLSGVVQGSGIGTVLFLMMNW